MTFATVCLPIFGASVISGGRSRLQVVNGGGRRVTKILCRRVARHERVVVGVGPVYACLFCQASVRDLGGGVAGDGMGDGRALPAAPVDARVE